VIIQGDVLGTNDITASRKRPPAMMIEYAADLTIINGDNSIVYMHTMVGALIGYRSYNDLLYLSITIDVMLLRDSQRGK
jgi:calcineurin-like phosphoesterase